MANSRETNQSNASDLGARCGGHDQFGRPPRGRHFAQSSDSLQRKPDLHLHWFYFGGCESLSDLTDLHGRANQIVQREENRRTATSYICHWR